ncbi:MAG: homocysteine S-methyltransferase family protein [Waltera sp.]
MHTEYLEAGAQILRTNTFAANSFCMDRSKEQIGGDSAKRAYAWRGSGGCVERTHR